MILSKEKINTGRQIEVDLMKAFCVVFSMIIIHVFDYSTVGFESNFIWWIDTIFGGIFAAPLFMFCMGIGTVYSRNSNPKTMAVRGLKLLTIGQVLNLFRYALIFFIQGLIEKDYDLRPAQALNFSSDIMQLAGLGFLLLALFGKLKLKNWAIFLISVAMSIAGTLLEQVQTGCYAFDQFLGLFWGTDTESYFPLLNWFIFIAAGKCFGSFYQRVQNKNALFLILAPIGMICFAVIWYFQKYTDCTFFNSFDDSYRGFCWMRIQDSLSVIIMSPWILSIFYLLSKILPQSTIGVLSHPSKHINQYYCISWWWIMVVHLFAWADNVEGLMSVWLNILTLTIITVVLYNKHYKDRVENYCEEHKVLLTALVWIITLGAALFAFAVCPELPNVFNDYLM